MGTLEQKTRKRARKKRLQKIILGTVAAAGVLSMAMLAPNAIQSLAKLGVIDMKRKRQHSTVINRARKRLLSKGLLGRDGKGYLYITKKGEALLARLELAEYRIRRPKKWDKKWRVLIFDIPEKRKKTREKIRKTLLAIGFVRLQDSVWIYPYDCEDLIALFKADFQVGKNLLYLVVEEMENDKSLKNRFNLQID